MNLKKTVIISLAALACAGFIAGCGSDKKDAASADPAKTKNEIKVGTTPGYSEQVVEFVAKEAEKEGLKVTIVPFSDYVTPNQALAQGDIDVNSYQHVPFLEAFNEKNGTKLIPIGNTYLAPLRLFSNKHKTLSDLPNGASIAIPNDPSNGGRALLLLEKNGLLIREPAPYDNRLKRIVLTDKALVYKDQVVEELTDLEETLVRGIPEEKLEVFFEVIEKMMDNLSE